MARLYFRSKCVSQLTPFLHQDFTYQSLCKKSVSRCTPFVHKLFTYAPFGISFDMKNASAKKA